jgi:3-methyl-2-oxobutanoate hydroxymethyltransferase
VYVQNASNPDRKPVTVPGLRAMKAEGRRIVMLTAYDASFAFQLESAGVDWRWSAIRSALVQGHRSTCRSRSTMVYTRPSPVARSTLVADLPFMMTATRRTHSMPARVCGRGQRRWSSSKAPRRVLEAISALVARAIPVCAHLG